MSMFHLPLDVVPHPMDPSLACVVESTDAANGAQVCGFIAATKAHEIVEAVNQHAALKAACEAAEEAIPKALEADPYGGDHDLWMPALQTALDALRAALNPEQGATNETR